MTQRIDFIDVSHFQNEANSSGTIDWSKVKASGVLGVIIKATEGTSYTDKFYAANRAGALAAGLSIASYHYLKHGSASRQMTYYLGVADPLPGERVVIDYEDAPCTSSDLLDAVKALIEFRPDVQITVYGASKLTGDAKGHADMLAGTSLWAARYSSSEPVIATDVWPVWSAWQYSQSGQVSGISGNVDLNTFNGSQDNCVKWFGPAGAEPGPAPAPADKTVTVALTVPDGVTVAVSVNGEAVW